MVAQKWAMTRSPSSVIVIITVLLAVFSMALAAQDKYTLKVPNGLAFSEFRGYENWQDVAVSQTENGIKVIVANHAMIDAYRDGIPGNGKHFPNGSKVAKIEDIEKESEVILFRDGTGHPEIGFVHRKGYQQIPGHERMGIRPVSLWRRVRHVYA
jgi:hypothetical protein